LDGSRPVRQIAGEGLQFGIDEQVDGVIVEVFGEAIVYGEDQGGDAAFLPSFHQTAGIGADCGIDLAVEQAGSGPPEEHGEHGGADGKQAGVDDSEADAGGAEKKRTLLSFRLSAAGAGDGRLKYCG
jgi:hypothetical protein